MLVPVLVLVLVGNSTPIRSWKILSIRCLSVCLSVCLSACTTAALCCACTDCYCRCITRVHTHTHTHTHTYTHTHTLTHLHSHTHTLTHTHIHTHTQTHTHTFTHTHTLTQWSVELEDQEKVFLQQAQLVNTWDRMLADNGEKVCCASLSLHFDYHYSINITSSSHHASLQHLSLHHYIIITAYIIITCTLHYLSLHNI